MNHSDPGQCKLSFTHNLDLCDKDADAMTQKPNFFILGAAKSGTTALYYLLGKLPQVHLSTPKEPYYFVDEYERGPEYHWQTYYADGWRGQPLVGEAQTAHLFLPYVPQRIHQTVPDARLIVILRNPVDRAFSHWWMRRGNGRETLSFEESLRENQARIVAGSTIEGADAENLWRAHMAPKPDRWGVRPCSLRVYLEAGYYAVQLERYLQFFPRSQLCVLLLDEFIRAPLETTRQLFEFLGLDPSEVKRPPAQENVALTTFSHPLYILSHRLRLQSVLPRKFLAVARTTLSKIGRRPTMSGETRAWLCRHYESHNRRLEALLECDLDEWNH